MKYFYNVKKVLDPDEDLIDEYDFQSRDNAYIDAALWVLYNSNVSGDDYDAMVEYAIKDNLTKPIDIAAIEQEHRNWVVSLNAVNHLLKEGYVHGIVAVNKRIFADYDEEGDLI